MAPALQTSAWAVDVCRQSKRARYFYLAVLFWIGLTGSGCSRRSLVERRVLEMQVPTEIVELDPRFATRGLDVKASRLIHGGLVALDPDTLLPHTSLARSLSLAEGRTIAVELESNAHFHSGHVLEASDVCATLDALRDPQLQSPHRAVGAAFSTCRVRDAQHAELTLAYPRATWMTDLEMPILRADQAKLPRGHAEELDGLGPYLIAGRTANALLLRKATTIGESPMGTSVVIRTVRDENARVLRLLAGQADIAVNAISPALLPELARSGELKFSSRPGANVTYLLVHNDRAPFADANVRRALSLAIDRQSIVEHLLNRHAEPARWIFPTTHWASPSDLAPLRYDPDAARRVLNDKGPVTLLASPDRSRLTLALVIAQMLGDAGLQTQVVPLDLGVMLSRLDAGNFTMAILQIPELTEPNMLQWFFHPRGIPGEGEDGRNRARYRSVRAGELLDSAASSFELDVRKRLYGELAHLMMDDMPVIPLWHEDQMAVVATRVVGFRPTAAGHWDSLVNTELR
jgi:peptide/nickel transport system substrate-binding protein